MSEAVGDEEAVYSNVAESDFEVEEVSNKEVKVNWNNSKVKELLEAEVVEVVLSNAAKSEFNVESKCYEEIIKGKCCKGQAIKSEQTRVNPPRSRPH